MPLPPGFRLEETPQQPSNLPPGFKLESQTADQPIKQNPGTAGILSFGADTAGLLADTGANIINLGIAGAGRATGTTPSLIEKPILGSQWIKDKLRGTGIPELSPDNPMPNSQMAKLQYDLGARGGFIPGNLLAAGSSIAAEKIGGPQWSGVGAMAPAAAMTAYNALKTSGLAQQQAQNQVRDATLKPAQDAGYVLPPSAVQKSSISNIAESFAGKAALNQEASVKNQQVTNNLVRQELKLPENAPLTVETLEQARTTAAQPYRDIAALSPVAQKALERLRDARAEANVNFRHYDMTGTPQSLRDARAADAKATMLEHVLERQATSSGNPQLVQAMRDARAYIAKTWDVERALNVGNGNIDAHIIGRAIDRGRPLSGNLETIGKFAEAFPHFTREASKITNPAASALNAGASGVLGYEGFTHFGTPGLALAAVPFAREGLRQGMLSDLFQRNFNQPNYAAPFKPQGTLESLVQQAILANQQQRP